MAILKFSIITPNLNEENNLPLFLSSLTDQTFKDFEVIIVDGGSSDNSLKIIDGFRNRLNIRGVIDKTRNFGYIRNVGARLSRGTIMFHGSTDTYFEPELLMKLNRFYLDHPQVISVAGRTFPLGTSLTAHLGYQIFDFLRFCFTCFPSLIRKYRPSGNFTTLKTDIFCEIGGYPHVTVNEDGLLGQKLDRYAYFNNKSVWFNLNLYVGHHVKKFEEMGGIRAILFYLYTLRNLFPMLTPLLKPIENHAGKVFEGKTETKRKSLLKRLYDWL